MEFVTPKAISQLDERLLHQEDLLSKIKELSSNNSQKLLMIKGPVGCGQGIASRELSKFTKSGEIKKISSSSLIYFSAGETIFFLRNLLFENRDKLIYIYNIDDLFQSIMADVILEELNFLIKDLKLHILLTGEVGIDKINALNPELYSKFTLSKVNNMKPTQLVDIFKLELELRNIDYKFKDSDLSKLISEIRTTGNFKNARITRLMRDRALLDMQENNYSYLSIVSLRKSLSTFLRAKGESGYKELDELIGLSEIKDLVKLFMRNSTLDERRKSLGIDIMGMGQHMVFKGPAGTAKTTVARIVSKILSENGIITSGHLVETTKVDLVGATSDETTKKVNQIVRNALGGVLFIDEAYTLSSDPETRDQGKEAIDTLLKLMEDYREDFVVIVAGYPLEMDQFLSSNPGLRGRFARMIEFPSYTVEELLTILQFMANKRGFKLADDVIPAIFDEVSVSYHYPGFSNARYIRSLLETAILKQGSRLDLEASDDEISTLTAADFIDQQFKSHKKF